MRRLSTAIRNEQDQWRTEDMVDFRLGFLSNSYMETGE